MPIEEVIEMRRIILILIVAVVALIVAIKLGLLGFVQQRPAEVPGVEVTSNGITATGGQTPTFDVQTGTVAVGTRSANVAVPVPTVEVRKPVDNQVVPAPAPPQH
jgi:hypothetical protein